MRKLLMSFTIIATLSMTPMLASAADVADTAAPKAEFITLSPTALTATGGELTVEFIVSDEGSGLAGTNSNGASIPSITFKLQSSDKTFSPTNPAIRYKGDSTYGSYRSLVTIPSTLANGTWELFINPLRDQAGNSTSQISTGLTFLLGSANTAPSSPAPSGGSAPTTASASPETPLPVASVTPSAMATPIAQATPTPIASLTPTPQASATPSTVFAKPSPTPLATKAAAKKVVSKKKTITCRKGKLIKKITGINPKCPKGYK
jgi:hypothetical protein